MRNLNRPHTTAADRAGRRSPHAAQRSGRRAGDRRISDAVIAGYILDISERHRMAVAAPDRRARG